LTLLLSDAAAAATDDDDDDVERISVCRSCSITCTCTRIVPINLYHWSSSSLSISLLSSSSASLVSHCRYWTRALTEVYITLSPTVTAVWCSGKVCFDSSQTSDAKLKIHGS